MSKYELNAPARERCDSGTDQPSEKLTAQFLFDGALGELLFERLTSDVESARLSNTFRWFYRIRHLLPRVARQGLQRLRNGKVAQGKHDFAPTDVLDHFDLQGYPTQSVWPNSAECSLVLTHDVETKHGVKLIPQLASIEEELGFRSSWNVVPYKYKTDAALVRDMTQRGHEFGIHGYNHDGRLFLSRRVFDSRVGAINQAIEQFGAVGFRAPMVHRNLHWLQSLNIEYDASCFDADPFQAMPGGIGSLWPLIVGRFVELPYTLPQDHTLLVTLRHTSDKVWRDKLKLIRQCRGMALMLTHPDYLDSPSRLHLYRDFLAYLRDTISPWHVLPREMAAWTRKRTRTRPGDLAAVPPAPANSPVVARAGSPSQILVTGAAGFVGANVVRQLLDEGHRVVGVDNLNDYYSRDLKAYRLESLTGRSRFKFVEADIEDRQGLSHVFDGHDFSAVMNLAARAGVRASMENPFVYFSTNQGGTLNLLELMRERSIPKFVLASTSSLYAGQPTPFVESMPVNQPISPYAASKKAAEVLAYTYHHLYGIDVSIVRYFTVYGPAGRPDMSPYRFFNWIDREEPIQLYGDGKQRRDFTYVDCAARGTIAALKPVGYEIFNIGNESSHSIMEMIAIMESLVGKQAIVEFLPAHAADVRATCANTQKAESMLGWKSEISLQEGLTRTWQWHREYFASPTYVDS